MTIGGWWTPSGWTATCCKLLILLCSLTETRRLIFTLSQWLEPADGNVSPMFTRPSSRDRFSHRTHTYFGFSSGGVARDCWVANIASFFFLCVNSCGIVACVLSHTAASALAPFTEHQAACDLRCTACVFVCAYVFACMRASLRRSHWSTLPCAGFPDLGKKQQSFNGLSPAPGWKRAAGYV